jgi:hypothetical protein
LESGEVYSGGASTYVHGVAFPIDGKAMDALGQLVSGSVNYVQIVTQQIFNFRPSIFPLKKLSSITPITLKLTDSKKKFQLLSPDSTFLPGDTISMVLILLPMVTKH